MDLKWTALLTDAEETEIEERLEKEDNE